MSTEAQTLKTIKKCFKKVIPEKDSRATIPPLEFIVALVLSFQGDSKTYSIEGIRRFMISHLGLRIERHSFWERLSRKRLKKLLSKLVEMLMIKLSHGAFHGSKAILLQLGVSDVLLVDSSTISLWDGASENFPGTRTNAGIKWHACFSLFSGIMTWFELTPSSTNDRKCFPDIKELVGKLVIFDLGYWDYGLLSSIHEAKGFFLSRVKSNASILIDAVVEGLPDYYVGKEFSDIKLKKKNDVVEFIGSVLSNGKWVSLRIVGFWNSSEKRYHWYCTNLDVAAESIYPIYRLRWQCELIFKSCKNSLNANQITSNDQNIIESLLLASLAAHLTSSVVLRIGRTKLNKEQNDSTSFQRVAKVTVLLASDFIKYLLSSSQKYLNILIEKIKIFSHEIYDTNYRRRKTSMNMAKKVLL